MRETIQHRIHEVHPEWNEDSMICDDDLAEFRADYMRSLLESETGDLSRLEAEVLDSLRQHETVAKNPLDRYEQRATIGERLSYF